MLVFSAHKLNAGMLQQIQTSFKVVKTDAVCFVAMCFELL